jgi:signal peptidase I
MAKKIKTDFRYNEDDDRSIVEDLLGFVSTFLLCSIVIILIASFIIKPNVVSGRSMYPALQTDDRGFSSVINLISGINRGDIVTAKMVNAEDGETYDVVKRVIGLPGETIECIDGVVYIDGEVLDESAWIDEETASAWEAEQGSAFNTDFEAVTLGEDEYFLMGDNRPISMDSRDVGAISKDDIVAKDFFILYPFSRIGWLA